MGMRIVWTVSLVIVIQFFLNYTVHRIDTNEANVAVKYNNGIDNNILLDGIGTVPSITSGGTSE